MKKAETKEASLAEELPYWDFVESPKAHAILFDGSLVTGLQVSLVDIECLDADEINHFTMGLRSALNSISEGVSLQFALSVRSDFSEMIQAHEGGKSENTHPLVKLIADHREMQLKAAMDTGELYRPRLYVYLRTPLSGAKKLGFWKKKEMFSDQASKSYQETLEILSQNIDTLISSFGDGHLSTFQKYS